MTSANSSDGRIDLVWELAQQNISNQLAAVDELRSRVSSLLAAAAIANGFLSAQSFSNQKGFPAGAWTAVVSGLLLVAAIAYVLWPRDFRVLWNDTQLMLEDIDAGEYPDLDVMHRWMSYYYQSGFAVNRTTLRHLYVAFGFALGLLVINFGGWFWALTHK